MVFRIESRIVYKNDLRDIAYSKVAITIKRRSSVTRKQMALVTCPSCWRCVTLQAIVLANRGC